MAAFRMAYEAQHGLQAGAGWLTAPAARMHAVVLRSYPRHTGPHAPTPPAPTSTSRPDSATGSACAWMGVGFSYLPYSHMRAAQGHGYVSKRLLRRQRDRGPGTETGQGRVQLGLGLEITGPGSHGPAANTKSKHSCPFQGCGSTGALLLAASVLFYGTAELVMLHGGVGGTLVQSARGSQGVSWPTNDSPTAQLFSGFAAGPPSLAHPAFFIAAMRSASKPHCAKVRTGRGTSKPPTRTSSSRR